MAKEKRSDKAPEADAQLRGSDEPAAREGTEVTAELQEVADQDKRAVADDDASGQGADAKVADPAPSDTSEPAMPSDSPALADPLPHRPWWKRALQWAGSHKKIVIPVGVLCLIGMVAVIPVTRFAIAGLFMKQEYAVRVIDRQSGNPVSSVVVKSGGVQAKTDATGHATLKLPAGSRELQFVKEYYTSGKRTVIVPILDQKDTLTVKLEATGRQVPVSLVNTVSGKSVAGASLKAGKVEAKTDDDGKATLVVPAESNSIDVTVSASGYNTTRQTLVVSATPGEAQTISLTPAGRVYFFSNQSGTIDVVATDLDGANRQTVLAGTGKESQYETKMSVSDDGKYIALRAQREANTSSKLYLITTADNKLTVMDEGDKVSFGFVGWIGQTFVYHVNRQKPVHEAKVQALKSYDVGSKRLRTLDETEAGPVSPYGTTYGYAYQNFTSSYIIDKKIIYTTGWYQSGYTSVIGDRKNVILSINADGSGKKELKSFTVAYPGVSNTYLQARPKNHKTLYFSTAVPGNDSAYFIYEDGQVKDGPAELGAAFGEMPDVFVVSPSGEQVAWTEYRDSKPVVMVGNSQAAAGKQIFSAADFTVRSWIGNDYLILTKQYTELYVIPATGLPQGREPLKVSNYLKRR